MLPLFSAAPGRWDHCALGVPGLRAGDTHCPFLLHCMYSSWEDGDEQERLLEARDCPTLSVWLHLEHWVQLWALQYKKDVKL